MPDARFDGIRSGTKAVVLNDTIGVNTLLRCKKRLGVGAGQPASLATRIIAWLVSK